MADLSRQQHSLESDCAIADVLLAPLTTLGVGGPAGWYYRATTTDSIVQALAWANERSIDVFVLGGGSNVVVADEGWPGLVLHVAVAGVASVPAAGGLRCAVGAGEPWDGFVADTVSRGFCGIECLSGIPGTVGGTPVQNVGAYGQEVAAVIESVAAIDRRSRAPIRFAASECGFGYRMSRFKGADAGRFVIAEVTFHLSVGNPTITYPDVLTDLRQRAIMSPTVHDVRAAILAIRRRKGMVLDDQDPDTRSVGSFFMNPTVSRELFAQIRAQAGDSAPGFPTASGDVKIPAAWLIERAGFQRGAGDEGAGISSKHPLAIVNRACASARDIVALAVRIKRAVAHQFGVCLLTEPVFVGFGRDADVEFLTTGPA